MSSIIEKNSELIQALYKQIPPRERKKVGELANVSMVYVRAVVRGVRKSKKVEKAIQEVLLQHKQLIILDNKEKEAILMA